MTRKRSTATQLVVELYDNDPADRHPETMDSRSQHRIVNSLSVSRLLHKSNFEKTPHKQMIVATTDSCILRCICRILLLDLTAWGGDISDRP